MFACLHAKTQAVPGNDRHQTHIPDTFSTDASSTDTSDKGPLKRPIDRCNSPLTWYSANRDRMPGFLPEVTLLTKIRQPCVTYAGHAKRLFWLILLLQVGVFPVALLHSSSAFSTPPGQWEEPRSRIDQEHTTPRRGININRAGQKELAQRLSGVGMRTAGAIILFRKANGPFRNVDELLLVRGIGPALLERNRAFITIE